MKIYDQYFDKVKNKVPTLQIYMESPRKNLVYQYADTYKDQRYHSASIGKLFCATLVFMAIEEKLCSLETKISNVLESKILENLFVYKDIDYKNQVTIKQLLNHTSGVNDYFEGKTINHRNFLNEVMSDKDHIYTPLELVDFTRKNQKAVGYPGKKMLYTDTGYVLLGLILESLYQKPYADILKEKIIIPLGLKDTALAFYDENYDRHSLAPLVFKGQDTHLYNSLSCDYSGGGLQTTTKDLAIFLKHLFSNDLISQESLDQMMDAKQSFHGIMRYGLGMIEIDFKRLVPWMRNYPKLYGGLGFSSCHAFYDPVYKDVYVINLGTPKTRRLSFQILVKMAKWLND